MLPLDSNSSVETTLRESTDIVDRLHTAKIDIQHQIDFARRLIAESFATLRQVDATATPLHVRYDPS